MEQVSTHGEWTNDADFLVVWIMKPFKFPLKNWSLLGEMKMSLPKVWLRFCLEWHQGSFGEGRANSIKLGLDNDGGPVDIRGIFSADTALTVRFLGQPMDEQIWSADADLSNKSIYGPQPGEAGSIYAAGDFGWVLLFKRVNRNFRCRSIFNSARIKWGFVPFGFTCPSLARLWFFMKIT